MCNSQKYVDGKFTSAARTTQHSSVGRPDVDVGNYRLCRTLSGSHGRWRIPSLLSAGGAPLHASALPPPAARKIRGGFTPAADVPARTTGGVM